MFFQDKTINGKSYRYLVKSIRLPDGRVKTLQKLVKNKNHTLQKAKQEYKDYFIERERKAYADYALSTFKEDAIYTKQQMAKLEAIKVDYRNLISQFTKEQLSDVFDRFTANFTYESNAIEGNSLTLKDVAVVMFEDRSIEGKELREIYETKNSRDVVNLMLKNKFKVTEADIIRMHKILVKDIDARAGYKKFPNFLVGRNITLAKPEEVPGKMKELISWYKSTVRDTHPLKVAALFHGRFERIHPFSDGNGRVGRFLTNIILINHKYPPLIIRKSQRTSYLKCLEDADNGYTANLKRFFLAKYKDTYQKFFAVYAKYT